VEKRHENELSVPTHTAPGGWRRRAQRTVAVLGWLYLLVVAIAWALLGLADVWWPATLLMFSPRGLLLAPAVLLVPAAMLRQRRTLGVVLLALILTAGPVMNFAIPRSLLSSSACGGPRLRVMTCNMHYAERDRARLEQVLADARPDIVALQEWPGWEKHEAFPRVEWQVHGTPALFLASRLPITRTLIRGERSVSTTGALGRYELRTESGIFTLFNLHFASPREGLYDVTHDKQKGVENLQEGTELRWEQSENVANEANDVVGPVLLVGDFNTPPESAIFRSVWSRYTDAFSSAGWGWGYTFIGGRTTVRIDHILASPGWHCERCWVAPSIGSPHRPVIADLVWTAN
jgi:endonuclease/exonuclease/phosphatase (EEP) superfamily protein YafD